MKRLVFWAGCSRLWVRVVFVCKVWSLSVCIFSFSWLMRTALSQRRNGVDRVVFSNNLPGTEQWKERDFIYSWWTDRGLCWELAKSQRQKERPQGWGMGVLRPSKATGFHWCAQPKGVRTWVAPDTCLGKKKVACGLSAVAFLQSLGWRIRLRATLLIHYDLQKPRESQSMLGGCDRPGVTGEDCFS